MYILCNIISYKKCKKYFSNVCSIQQGSVLFFLGSWYVQWIFSKMKIYYVPLRLKYYKNMVFCVHFRNLYLKWPSNVWIN